MINKFEPEKDISSSQRNSISLKQKIIALKGSQNESVASITGKKLTSRPVTGTNSVEGSLGDFSIKRSVGMRVKDMDDDGDNS